MAEDTNTISVNKQYGRTCSSTDVSAALNCPLLMVSSKSVRKDLISGRTPGEA